MRRLRRCLVAFVVVTMVTVAWPARAVTTSDLRRQWGPGCTPASQLARVTFPSGARITVASRAAEAFGALATTTQSFNYPVRIGDTGAYNCRRITGGSGLSLHSFGIATDLNWQSNPYSKRLITDMQPPPDMVNAIKGIRTNGGQQVFRWGGDYSVNKDAMHYELIVSPAQLATGVNWSTVARGGRPVPPPVVRPGVPVARPRPATVGGARKPAARPRTKPSARQRTHTTRHCHRDRRRPRCHTARHRINSGHHR